MLEESEMSFLKLGALQVSSYFRFCASKWLDSGVHGCLTEVSTECRFTYQ